MADRKIAAPRRLGGRGPRLRCHRRRERRPVIDQHSPVTAWFAFLARGEAGEITIEKAREQNRAPC
jgi:hypothetical protein